MFYVFKSKENAKKSTIINKESQDYKRYIMYEPLHSERACFVG